MDARLGTVDVATWHERLARRSFIGPASIGARSSIAHFRDTEARIDQPALEQTVLAVHLGGPKRIIRRQGARQLEVDVAENSLTLMPANEAFEWETFGPIAFAHLVLDRADLDRAAAEEGLDPAKLKLDPLVGSEDPLLSGPIDALLRGLDDPADGRLFRDQLAATLARSVVRGAAGPARRGGGRHLSRAKLATWQLRRVVDFMHAQLADDIALDTLVALSGVGRARFFRGFKASIGQAPFEYLLSLRLLEARRLLVDTDRTVTEVASSVGLEPTRLAAAFRKHYDMTPRGFRNAFR